MMPVTRNDRDATIPLTDIAATWLHDLGAAAGRALPSAATLLGERAILGGFRIPARRSAGGGCRLYDTCSGAIALNLARPDDRDLLPALFEQDGAYDHAVVAEHMAGSDAAALVARGRMLGLAIAHDGETPPPACTLLASAPFAPAPARYPRVLDLSALWAGPLAAHLLWLCGASVTKAESRSRPDAMRHGDAAFFDLLHQGKTPATFDLHDRAALLALIAGADIVIEAARPRALQQLDVHADEIVRATPGLTWITITGHGAAGDAAHWIGFGDDCGIAGGLGAALRRATGHGGFVGDAIGDPLTGIYAARIAWNAWVSGRGGRYGVAMSGVVAEAIGTAEERDMAAFDRTLFAWASAAGTTFPPVERRAVAC